MVDASEQAGPYEGEGNEISTVLSLIYNEVIGSFFSHSFHLPLVSLAASAVYCLFFFLSPILLHFL